MRRGVLFLSVFCFWELSEDMPLIALKQFNVNPVEGSSGQHRIYWTFCTTTFCTHDNNLRHFNNNKVLKCHSDVIWSAERTFVGLLPGKSCIALRTAKL